MKSAGVICEFNPLHAGHAYLISQMRRAVGDGGCLVCVMSGRFVQRGTPAMFDPYLRAEWALACGADLVVELPFPWSAASAEHFAEAGVHILSALGADTLVFGSESDDTNLLLRAADAAMSADFGERYAALCRDGMGAAAAYASAIRARLGDGVPADFPAPNDLLGIAYLTALEKKRQAVGVAPDPLVVRREGAGYRDGTVPAEGYPSATALRRIIKEAFGDPYTLSAALTDTMPTDVLSSLCSAMARGDAPIDGDGLLPFFHAYYRLESLESTEACAECGGGAAGRILRCAKESATPTAFFGSLRSARYTNAHLRRALLFGALGVTAKDLRTLPSYTVLMGANERGRAYLRDWQKAHGDDRDFQIVTKPADTPEGRQSELSMRADSLFTLCYPIPRKAGDLRKRAPIIE